MNDPARHPELLRYRDEFPILATTTHLISHSLGPMPARALERVAEFTKAWNERGVRAWEESWWDLPRAVGDQLGRAISAPPGSIAMHQNVSIAVAQVLSCFLGGASSYTGHARRRNRVVFSEMNFPSVMYVLRAHTPAGLEVVTVPSEDGITVDLDRLLAAIDERTLLVPISHVLFRSSYIQDAAAICRRAREVGAHVLLDVYQSAGCVPLDLVGWGADFAVGGSVKWLCGGPGAGWLYVREDLQATLAPAITGWAAHEDPFAFEEQMRLASGIARFATGTPNVPALSSARAGYEIVAEVGVDRIREASMRHTARIINRADRLGIPVRSPRDPARRGGTVVLDVQDGARVVQELARRDILVDHRPGAGIRVSAHFFNTDAEIDRFFAAIEDVGRAPTSR